MDVAAELYKLQFKVNRDIARGAINAQRRIDAMTPTELSEAIEGVTNAFTDMTNAISEMYDQLANVFNAFAEALAKPKEPHNDQA